MQSLLSWPQRRAAISSAINAMSKIKMVAMMCFPFNFQKKRMLVNDAVKLMEWAALD